MILIEIILLVLIYEKKFKKNKSRIKTCKSNTKIRSKNNKNWMDLLRLSLKLDFNSTSKILKEI